MGCGATHAAVHAGGVGQHQAMNALVGDDEDEHIVEGFLDGHAPRQN